LTFGMKNLVRVATNTFVLYLEVPGGGRRSSQLPLGHYVAHASAPTIVMLTIVIVNPFRCNYYSVCLHS
jgi:hypothetical protein